MDIGLLHITTDPHAFEVSWDAFVAVGTIGLAAVTWRLARSTRALAGETAADIRGDIRPVLIDGGGGSLLVTYDTVPPQSDVDDGIVEPGRFKLVLKNVGPGPSLNATVTGFAEGADAAWASEVPLGTTGPAQSGPSATMRGLPRLRAATDEPASEQRSAPETDRQKKWRLVRRRGSVESKPVDRPTTFHVVCKYFDLAEWVHTTVLHYSSEHELLVPGFEQSDEGRAEVRRIKVALTKTEVLPPVPPTTKNGRSQ